MLKAQANQMIRRPDEVEDVMFEQGNTRDIITVILYADQFNRLDLAKFAPLLKGGNEMTTLRNVFRFIKDNIEYIADESGHERVKSPAKTWWDGYGDCKSMSCLAGGLLKVLSFDFFYRFVGFDKALPVTHVYVMARTRTGRLVAIDAVHTRFNEQPSHSFSKDYPNTLAAVGGIKRTNNFSIKNIFWLLLLLGLAKQLSRP